MLQQFSLWNIAPEIEGPKLVQATSQVYDKIDLRRDGADRFIGGTELVDFTIKSRPRSCIG